MTEPSSTEDKAAAAVERRRDRLTLRWRVTFACIAAALLAIALLFNFLGASRSEDAVRRKADEVLAERFASVFAERVSPVAGERAYPESGGSAFQFVFWAQSRVGSSPYAGELIFVVPIAGLSGPVLSVFYYTQGQGAVFLGNFRGVEVSSFQAGGGGQDAGISEGNLRKWTAKIEEAARGIIASAGPQARVEEQANVDENVDEEVEEEQE